MKRLLWTTLVLAAIVGAFFLGRATRESPQARTAPAPVAGDAADAAALADRGVPPGDHGIRPAANTSGRRTPAAPASTRPTATPAPESGAGPKPLSAEGEQRLRTVAERMVRLDQRTGELYQLAENEPPGPDSAYLEELIASTIRRYGGGYTGLELSRPRCTQTVCMLMATGGTATQDPRSDWQRLSGVVMSQPWFRQYFDDSSTLVTNDDQGVLYLTYFIRCPPGSCRYGR